MGFGGMVGGRGGGNRGRWGRGVGGGRGCRGLWTETLGRVGVRVCWRPLGGRNGGVDMVVGRV